MIHGALLELFERYSRAFRYLLAIVLIVGMVVMAFRLGYSQGRFDAVWSRGTQVERLIDRVDRLERRCQPYPCDTQVRIR